MVITKIKIDQLIEPKKNVRIHTENQINEFVRSINMFGQIRPVVIDENNMVLAGNGLVKALKKAGVDKADVYKIDNLTSAQKKKLMIADNKIFSLGIENLDTLNDFLEELNGDLDIPGFDEEILQSMVADADEITEKLSMYGTLDEEEIDVLKNNSVRKEQQIAKVQLHNNEIEQQQVANQQRNLVQEHNSETKEDESEQVICPKCGEKIWL